MSPDLELYHKILFIDRPWLNTSTTDAKFLQLLHAVINENFAQQPIYELSFPKPLTPKTKYYQAIIKNEAVRFLNSVHALINSALTDNERKFHIHSILSKKLPAKLGETEKIITSERFYLSLIDNTSSDKKQREGAFILQYLKYRLIHLYLEIQNGFSSFVTGDIFTDEEINSIYFNEAYNPFIKTIPGWDPSSSKKNGFAESERKKFKVIKGDFRPGKKGILAYEQLISHSPSFARAEEELYNDSLIDENYNFTNKHTEKQKLAAMYHVLIRKGYFGDPQFRKTNNIKDVDIRKFLDHRYCCDLDAQFRTWANDKTGLGAYIDKFYWMDNLSHS